MKIRHAIALTAATLMLCPIVRAQAEAGFPSEIKTTDGRVYHDTSKLRVYPDGILVSYEPSAGGIGFAKLKFRELPAELQQRYGYDAKAASDYENQQAQVSEESKARMAVSDAIMRYRTLAELNRELGGDSATSYSLTMDPSGKISVGGVTGTPRSLSVTNVSRPAYLSVPYQHGYQTDYVPMPAPQSPVMPQ